MGLGKGGGRERRFERHESGAGGLRRDWLGLDWRLKLDHLLQIPDPRVGPTPGGCPAPCPAPLAMHPLGPRLQVGVVEVQIRPPDPCPWPRGDI